VAFFQWPKAKMPQSPPVSLAASRLPSGHDRRILDIRQGSVLQLLSRLIASDCRPLQSLRRIWYGKTPGPPTYHIAVAIFLRMLGLVYLIAFLSLWIQVHGLVGDRGILPVADFLDASQSYLAAAEPAASPYWNIPTLLWYDPHDGLLHLLCAGGTLFSLLVIGGILQMPALVLLWMSYLSLFYAGQEFLSFQWDILLLETGFLAIFAAPCAWRSGFPADRHPSRLAIGLLWWLLFRLMLESGAVKLTWNDGYPGPGAAPLANAWESLTALEYHYWTQPLPTWISWYAAKLPGWFQKLSVISVFVIELLLPWFVFGPRLLRYVAFGGFTLLMLLIAATGNYNFFNLLALVLALTLLDDGAWPRFLRRRIHPADKAPHWLWRNILLVPFTGLAILLGTLQLNAAIRPARERQPALEYDLHIAQFFLVNDYGLFRQMTETRPEIVIEGSADGINWKAYEFRWKPGDPAVRPRLCAPHQPRLDWQMWFEALQLEQANRFTGTIDRRYMSPWFRSFLDKILSGEPQVVALLQTNPFPDASPRFVRVLLYQYRFTTCGEYRTNGDWWHRHLVRTGSPRSFRALRPRPGHLPTAPDVDQVTPSG
jgi:hypothetical protein